MSPELAWYLARASGLVAWTLATASVVWGLLLSTRVAGHRPSPGWLADLHRYLGGLAVTFTAVHLAALLADTWVPFGIVDVLVPFASRWRPLAVAWGVVAFHLLVAIEVTSLLRRRIATRWWRRLHLSSFVVFATGTLHLLTAGTDAGSTWVRAAVAAAVTAVAYLQTVRMLTPRRRRARGRSGGRVAAASRPGTGDVVRPTARRRPARELPG